MVKRRRISTKKRSGEPVQRGIEPMQFVRGRNRRALSRPTSTCIVPDVGAACLLRETGRAAPSTRHRWCPRPDLQRQSGCVGRDVLAGACKYQLLATPVQLYVRVRSRSSAGHRWSGWKAYVAALPKTASVELSTRQRLGRSLQGTQVRGTSNVRPWNPVVTAIAGFVAPFPRHRTRTPRRLTRSGAASSAW